MRKKIHIIIFGVDTKAGRYFDILLLWAILFSVAAVMLESVRWVREDIGDYLYILEWFFTVLFSLEYILRIYSSEKPLKYIFSFYGIIDLICIIPTFLSVFMIGTHSLLAIRTIRLMRVFRVLKLLSFMKEAQSLIGALKKSRHKIVVFLFSVLAIATIMGTIMYIVEPRENGFTSIPRSIYWAIVTMTTVGFGDIYPQTALGQTLASILMIMGYAIIAVPTGIVTAQVIKEDKEKCTSCAATSLSAEDVYCSKCGTKRKSLN